MTIRLLLRDLRTSRELSQEELARALNLSRQSIISLERGEYLPSSPVLLAMMEFFNCSIHELVDGINIRVVRLTSPDQNEADNESIIPLITSRTLEALGRHQELREIENGENWVPEYVSAAGAMNIAETDIEYQIEVQALGFSEQDLSLEVTNNTLTISGTKKTTEDLKNLIHAEWQNNEFSRSVSFASPIDEDKVEARLENGTLTVVAPKAASIKPRIKKIEVKKK